MSSYFKSRRQRANLHLVGSQDPQDSHTPWAGLEPLEARNYMSAGPFEFGSSIGNANGLGSVAQVHALNSGINSLAEIDVFAIEVAAGQRYTFDINGDGSLDSHLRIFNAAGKQVASNNNGKAYGEAKSRDSFATVTFKTAGTYYVGVTAAGNAKYNIITDVGAKAGKTTGNYELIVTNVTPDDAAGNTLPLALNLGDLDGQSLVQDFVGRADKLDYYRFTLDADAAFVLSLTGLTGDANVRLVQDANFNNKIAKNEVIATSTNTGTANELIEANLSAGTYYIEVTSAAGDTYYNLNLNAELVEQEVVVVEPEPEPVPPVEPDITPEPEPEPLPEPEPQPVSDWFSQNLTDSGIISLSRSLFADGSLSRGDMMLILQVAGDDDGIVDASELTDLRLIVSNANTLGLTDDVRVLASKVVNAHTANAKYKGAALGNLAANSTDAHLDKLIDKWFMGGDRPNATIYGTTYQYRLANGSLFVNGASLTDIKQGYVGDCYLLASLGSVAMIDPGAISQMFIDNGDGTFAVRYFRNGVADYVTVDLYLPTDTSGRFIFANMGAYASSASNELWVALAEKAYAQLNEAGWIGQDGTNSYSGIEGGWMESVYEQVLGRNAISSYKPSQTNLINSFNAGKMISLGSNSSTTNGVVGGHAYVLQNYNSATGLFQLYNPWATQHVSLTYAQVASNFDWMASA